MTATDVPRYDPTDKDDPKKGTREEERRGPFPVGVAIENKIPATWINEEYGREEAAATVLLPVDGLMAAGLTVSARQLDRPQQRLIVFGSGNLFAGAKLEPPQEKLLLHSVNWLTGREDRLPRAEEPAWSFPRVAMTDREQILWRLGTAIGLPLVAIYMGLMVMMVRAATLIAVSFVPRMVGIAMNVKSTAMLVLLASAAALWYFKGDAWGPAVGIKPAHREAAKSAAESQLDDLTPAAINHVEIAFPNGESLVLDRAANEMGWKLPGNWPLRKREVEELVDTLGSLRSRFHAIELPPGANLAQYGLAADQKPVVVKLTTTNQVLTLTFGEPKTASDETAFTRAAYVRVNDAPELVKLGPDVMPVVRRSADSYKRRTLFPDIERVKLAGGGFASPGAAVVSLPGPETVSIRVARTPPHIWNLDLSPEFAFTLARIGKLPEPAAVNKGDDPSVPADRLADEWALESPARSCRTRSASLGARGHGRPVGRFLCSRRGNGRAARPPLALPTLFDSFAGLGHFVPISTDLRTGLAGATESLTVTRRNGEPVTIRFGGIAKMGEREEMISVPGGPPGSPPRMIPNKVFSSYRFARLDGNPQAVRGPRREVARLVRDHECPRRFPGGPLQPRRGSRDRAAPERPSRDQARDDKGESQIDEGGREGKPVVHRRQTQSNPGRHGSRQRTTRSVERLPCRRARRTLYPAEPAKPSTRVTIITARQAPDGEPDGPAHELTLLLGPPNYAKRQLPVQLAGWPRIALVDNNLGSNDSNSWVTGLLFPNTISDLIDRPAISYRNRKLFDAAAELVAVSVAGQFTLKRDPDEWKLTAPIASNADPGKAGELVSALTGLAQPTTSARIRRLRK